MRGIPEGQVVEMNLTDIDLADDVFEFRVDHKIKDLAEDIKVNGQQFPVTLRKRADGQYQLVSGFRRCRSIRALGWNRVKAIVREDLDDDAAFRVSFLENERRKSLTGKDKANAIAKLKVLGKSDDEIRDLFGIGLRQLQRYKKVTSFPDELTRSIAAGHVQTTHALELMRVYERVGQELDLLYWVELVHEKNLSVRNLVRKLNSQFGKPKKRTRYLERTPEGGFRLFPMRFDPRATDAKTREAMADRLKEALTFLEEFKHE